MRESVHLRAVLLLLALCLPVAACGPSYGPPDSASGQLGFGVDMAKRSLWSEALFRFHQAERLDPGNPRILNNLAVAYEATGQFEQALEYYQKALKMAPDNRELRANYARFVEFYQGFRPRQEGEGQPARPAANASNAANAANAAEAPETAEATDPAEPEAASGPAAPPSDEPPSAEERPPL